MSCVPTSCEMNLLLKYFSSRAASILGSKSGWVCPTCLVPRDFLWDLSEVIYPLRTWDGTLRLIEKAEDCSTKARAYEVLLNQSIRNIPVFVNTCKGVRCLTFIPEYIPQPLQPLPGCLQHILSRCSSSD